MTDKIKSSIFSIKYTNLALNLAFKKQFRAYCKIADLKKRKKQKRLTKKYVPSVKA